MDFTKLKELAKKVGGILVVEGGKPEFIILPYENYIANNEETSSYRHSDFNGNGGDNLDNRQGDIESLNREILALKEEIRQKESIELAESADLQDSMVASIEDSIT